MMTKNLFINKDMEWLERGYGQQSSYWSGLSPVDGGFCVYLIYRQRSLNFLS